MQMQAIIIIIISLWNEMKDKNDCNNKNIQKSSDNRDKTHHYTLYRF